MGLFDLFKKKKTDDERDLEEVTKKESASKDTTPIAPTMSLEDTRDEVIKLLKEDRKIPAVKYVKDNAGVGLKEAKDYVDSIEAEMASNSTSEDKQSTTSTNNTFCMGVEAKFLLDGVKLFTGTVIGTAKVGDEICIVNPGDNEVLFSDVITFDTPNVIKAKIARIELGKDRTSVDSVKNDKANFIFDEDLDYFIRTGTVFCSNGSSGNIVHQSYCAGLGNGLIRFAHLDISDEVYSKMSAIIFIENAGG